MLLLPPCVKGTELLLKKRSENIIIVLCLFFVLLLCFWHNFAITKSFLSSFLPGAGG